MHKSNLYSIPFVGLKNGEHTFEFLINDIFFVEYGNQDFSDSNIKINTHFIKNTHLFQLTFLLDGTIKSTCDRCCNDLDIEILNEFKLFIKMVSNPDTLNEQESDPDILYIGFNDSHIHLADLFYEYMGLSIPAIKYCTDYENNHCDPKTLEILKKLSK